MRRNLRALALHASLLVPLPAGADDPDFQRFAEECRAKGGEEHLCRSLEQLGRVSAQACRFGAGPAEQCGLFDRRTLSSAEVDEYESTWVHRALRLQWRLDEDRPLRRALLPSTHNSFNSAAYTPTLSGLDHNQVYPLGDQLRMDMRGLELDVHWVPSPHADAGDRGFAPILCHGKPVELEAAVLHFGCTAERHLRDGLAEIRAWLDNHGDEFVLLYLENNLDGDARAHDAAARAIADTLGGLVYRPPATDPCAAIPLDLSRRAILDTGARVLIAGNCGPGSWGNWVHKRGDLWEESKSAPGPDYPEYPACAAPGGEREAKRYDSQWIRYYEDSTWLTAMAATPGEITTDETRRMVRCGVNMPGFDQLLPDDARLAALVWSWAEDEPATDPSLRCARHGEDGRFRAADCAGELPFACRNLEGAWTIAVSAGAWVAGETACPVGFAFAVPATGYENELLKAAKVAGGAISVWLNYRVEESTGAWTPPGG